MKSVTSNELKVISDSSPDTPAASPASHHPSHATHHSPLVTRLSSLITRYSSLVTLLFLAACAGTPPPDWKANAARQLASYQKQWLMGETRLAETSLTKARDEIARTGRLDLAAHAELVRCATHAAGLDFGPCGGYRAEDATPAEAAYARLLAGTTQEGDDRLLPEHYAGFARAKHAEERNRAAQAIADPFARLLASALLFKAGDIAPQTLGLASRTASEQGWRRPLLAWLHIQAKRAEAAGDNAALETLRRQIELASTPHRQ